MKKRKNVDETRVGRSAQGELPFTEWYSNSLIKIGENKYALVCEFKNTGYLSRTDPEKERKYRAYCRALNELPPYIHYEETIYNTPVSTDVYINAIASKDKFDNKYEEAFFGVERRFASAVEREISLKRYLLTLSTTVEDGEAPYNKLVDAYSALDSRFREMGSGLRILDPEAVFAELYHFYNPFGGQMPPLPSDLFRRGLTVKDFIAPDGISYEQDYVRLGASYCRIMSITSYGSEIVDTLTYTLLNNAMAVYLSKHIDHVMKEDALKSVKAQLKNLEQRRQARLQRNAKDNTSYMPLELIRAIEGCNQLLDALAGNEEFLRVTLYVMLAADSKKELDEKTARLKATALSVHCTLRPVTVFIAEALRSILPLGNDLLVRHQFMLSSEAAVSTPFSYESYFDPAGYYYGVNEHSGEPIIINRKLDKSSNGFVFGTSGSGKGMWIKNEIANNLWQPFAAEDETIIIDATGEYLPLASAVGGKIIELSSGSETKLNPLYISPSQLRLLGRDHAEASKISYMIALLSQMKEGTGLDATEKAIVDAVCSRCFKKKSPTLRTFFEELKRDGRTEATAMCSWLGRYVEGSVTLFLGDEEQDEMTHQRLTVYSVKELLGDLRNCGMLAMLEKIEERITLNSEVGRWTRVYVDEMHRYFDAERNPYAAQRFARLYSEARQFGAILTGITQLPLPVMNSKDGAVMLSNSRFVVMSELDAANIAAVSEVYGLNEDQQRTLASPDVGQYVVRTHGAPMSVKFVYPSKNLMYDLFNTSFETKLRGKEGTQS